MRRFAISTLTASLAVWGMACGGEQPAPETDAPASLAAMEVAPADAPVIQVYKTPTCGCCRNWVDHLRNAGFEVETHDTDQLAAVKVEHGVPSDLQSCHTAIVDGYVVEGHVPPADVAKLLAERPDIRGIAVPGMPVGSPGMEMGDRVDPYDVVAFDESGNTEVFVSHR